MYRSLSVIIPVYNVERYLEKCLKSIINQSYSNVEIILVNDGSTDDSLNICNKYEKQYSNIKVYSQCNRGVAATRNIGLKYATGEYITFVDSDDYVHKDIYSKTMAEANTNNLDIVEFGCFHVKYGNIINSFKFEDNKIINGTNALIRLLSGKAFNVMWNKIYKRELFNDIEFPEGKIYEDGSTMYKIMLKVSRYKSINAIYYYHVINDDSIMGRQRVYSYNNLDGLESQLERYNYLNLNCNNKEIIDRSLASYFYESVYHYKQLSINEQIDPNCIVRKKIFSQMKVCFWKIIRNKHIGKRKYLLIFSIYNKKLSNKVIELLS